MATPEQLFRLDGKTLLICGASSGLGRAIALDAARLGAQLIVVARREALLDSLLAELEGQGHRRLCLDLASEEGRALLAAEARNLDGMVYAAGSLGKLVPFHLLREDLLEEQYRANALLPLLVTRALLAAKAVRNGASLVYLVSAGARISPPASAAYSGSKAFLAAALRSVALDVVKKQIRINSVMYGYVLTDAMQQLAVSDDVKAMAPLGLPEPEAVTGAPLFLLSDSGRWMTRSSMTIDAGLTLRQKVGI